MFELLKWMMLSGSVVVIAFLILLAMPKSELRSVLMPIVGWAMAVFCGLYVVSPVDIIPEALLGPIGVVDDIAAIFAGISAAKMAMAAKDE